MRKMGRKVSYDINAVNAINRNINELYINNNDKNPIYGTSLLNLPFVNSLALFSVIIGGAR